MNSRTIIIIIVLLALGFAIYVMSKPQEVAEVVEQAGLKRVETSLVGDLTGSGEQITAFGQVVSVTGVDVIPEVGGVVSRVYKRLGEVVRPGEVVIELQNSSQAQAVAQAQASLSSAEASLITIQDGADREVLASSRSAVAAQESALSSAQQATLSTLDSLYTSLEATISGNIDSEFFNNTHTDYPDFDVDLDNNARELALGEERAAIRVALEQGRSYNDVDAAVEQLIDRVQEVRALSESIYTEIFELEVGGNISQNSVEGWLSDLSLTQSKLDSFNTQAQALKSSLVERREAVTSARVNLEELEKGADSQEIAIARAAVSQAEAALRSAQIEYNKTRVTAPVLGTISEIDVTPGSLVGQSGPVFSIANENVLRIDTNITLEEARSISVGDTVVVDDTYEAYVSIIAPSVDSVTGKISVQVLLSDQTVRMPAGQGVGLEFSPQTDKESASVLSIPIEAVFVREEKPHVYVLVDGKAMVREITTESLFGSRIQVLGGLESSDTLILSARGVKDNEEVSVIESNN